MAKERQKKDNHNLSKCLTPLAFNFLSESESRQVFSMSVEEALIIPCSFFFLLLFSRTAKLKEDEDTTLTTGSKSWAHSSRSQTTRKLQHFLIFLTGTMHLLHFILDHKTTARACVAGNACVAGDAFLIPRTKTLQILLTEFK